MFRCAGCQKKFRRVSGFDAHRTGSFAPGARRCRSEEEIRARGMITNGSGVWHFLGNATNTERIRALQRHKETPDLGDLASLCKGDT